MNLLTQKQAVEMLHRYYEIERWVKTLKEERENLEAEFARTAMYGEDVPFPCQFLPGPCDGCREDLQLSGRQGIIVRNRNSVSLCGNCLRVTVGTRRE